MKMVQTDSIADEWKEHVIAEARINEIKRKKHIDNYIKKVKKELGIEEKIMEENFINFVTTMSCGNPGALSAIMEMVSTNSDYAPCAIER